MPSKTKLSVKKNPVLKLVPRPKAYDYQKKVAAHRSSSDWLKNVKKGRIEARLYPSYIRLLRDDKYMDQSTLAGKVQLTNSTFGAMERGKRLVPKQKAEAIARALEVPVSKIFQKVEDDKFKAILKKVSI